MPGGNRGSLTEIGVALNGPKPKLVEKFYMDWIDAGYEVVASGAIISAATAVCRRPKDLRKIWCYALSENQDVAEY